MNSGTADERTNSSIREAWCPAMAHAGCSTDFFLVKASLTPTHLSTWVHTQHLQQLVGPLDDRLTTDEGVARSPAPMAMPAPEFSLLPGFAVVDPAKQEPSLFTAEPAVQAPHSTKRAPRPLAASIWLQASWWRSRSCRTLLRARRWRCESRLSRRPPREDPTARKRTRCRRRRRQLRHSQCVRAPPSYP